jgi:hypothetical protein
MTVQVRDRRRNNGRQEVYDQRCCYRIWFERWERAGLFAIKCDDSDALKRPVMVYYQPTTLSILRRRLRLLLNIVVTFTSQSRV